MANLSERKDAVLLLEDGTVFHGKSAGIIGTTTGEIAFNTGMTGYQEIFTDPSYYGQILIMTPAHIGNYGVHEEEVESNSVKIAGLVTKKFSDIASRVGGNGSLQNYLEANNKVAICDVDTRRLVRHIRVKGAMNAIISSEILEIAELQKRLSTVPSMQGLELSSHVTVSESIDMGDPHSDYKIALLDLGVKLSIARCLVERGCHVRIFPLTTPVSEILAFDPDGIMFSNGPGDPSAMPETIITVGELIKSGLPCFGICLGHQVMAISQGLRTEKMFNGHRGVNHPVMNLETNRGEITSQNHGFVVSEDSTASQNEIAVTHRHLNDDSIAGLKYAQENVFSVQYHPEASAGPHDSRYLFDQFVAMVGAKKKLNKTTINA